MCVLARGAWISVGVCGPHLITVVRRRVFTAGRDVGEMLTLAPFPFAVADVEVDVDGRGDPLVTVLRDFDEE